MALEPQFNQSLSRDQLCLLRGVGGWASYIARPFDTHEFEHQDISQTAGWTALGMFSHRLAACAPQLK